MKDMKRRLETYSFFDRTGIEAHLTSMAAKGWMIEKLTNFGWIYRRTKARQLTFCVTYYPDASDFDPAPSEKQNTFYAFCEHAGWALAASSAQMQIFYTDQAHPVPIETDPELEVENIHRSAKKGFLRSYFLLFIVTLLNGGLFLYTLGSDPVWLLSSNTNLFTGSCWLILLLLCAAELGSYFSWRLKAQKAAKRGEFLVYKSTRRLQRIALYYVLSGGLCWLIGKFMSGSPLQSFLAVMIILYMVFIFFFVNFLKEALKKRKTPAKANQFLSVLSCFILGFTFMSVLTFATLQVSSQGWFAGKNSTYNYHGTTFTIYLDELPLTVEDLLPVEYDGYIRRRTSDESFMLGQFEMEQEARLDAKHFGDMPGLRYTITEVRLSFLYDLCKNALLRKQNITRNLHIPEGHKNLYQPADAAPWNALEAYQLFDQDTGARNRYLLCYEKRIIEIDFDWTPTLEQMAVTAKKLA